MQVETVAATKSQSRSRKAKSNITKKDKEPMDTNVMTATDADLAGLGLDPNDLVEAPVIPAAAPAADVLIDAPEAGDSPAEPEGDEVRKPKGDVEL